MPRFLLWVAISRSNNVSSARDSVQVNDDSASSVRENKGTAFF